MARGNNKMNIFLDDLDHVRFREMLADVVPRYEIDLWVYCLMRNHFHLVVRTRQPNPSLAIQQLNGPYAQWWNKRHRRIGHVLQGRFKAQLVEAQVYLLRLCRYVLLNPVRAGLCAHPAEWRWNSYQDLTGERSCEWLDVASLLQCLSPGSLQAARGPLLEYIEPETDTEMSDFIRGDRRIIGTQAYAAQFRRPARAASREVPRRERRAGTPALADILSDAVSRGEGLPGGIKRASSEGLYPATEIARCAGVSRATVQRILQDIHAGERTGGPVDPPAADRDLTPGPPGPEHQQT
jgi:putative transposase